MARRIEIELTSARPDGTWTWRAAGALNPRGSVEAALLYGGAKQGDVVRAEADFSIDGITIVSVEPPRGPQGSDPNRIELLERPVAAGVTTQLAPSHGRTGDRERGGRGERGERGGDRGQRGPDRKSAGQPARSFERSGPRAFNGNAARTPVGPPGEAGQTGDRERAERRPRPQPTDRPDRRDLAGRPAGVPGAPGERAERPPRTERSPRPERPGGGPTASGGAGRSGPGRGATGPRRLDGTAGGEDREAGVGREAQRRGPNGAAPAHRQRRLSPGNTHRDAMLESLPAEQQPIAQQLLRGGIPAVRTALHFERERARDEGRPEPSTEGVLTLAEALVSKVKAAEWRDRAEAALQAGDELAMRDLRSLVSGSDAARDEASRQLVVSLREMLERRVEVHRTSWASEVSRNLDEGHVIRSLRLSSRPPDAAARFSAELATRLRDAASAALSATAPAEQWLALLQAAAESPVRRAIKPEALPANPTPELLESARQQAGRVPGVAPLLGLSVPPPPPPSRALGAVKAPPRRPVRPGSLPPRPARPPRPPRPATAAGPSAGAPSGPGAPASRAPATRTTPADPSAQPDPSIPANVAGPSATKAPAPEHESFVRPASGEPDPTLAQAASHEFSFVAPVVDEGQLEEIVAEELAEATEAAPAAPEPMMDVPPEQLPQDLPVGAVVSAEELAAEVASTTTAPEAEVDEAAPAPEVAAPEVAPAPEVAAPEVAADGPAATLSAVTPEGNGESGPLTAELGASPTQ